MLPGETRPSVSGGASKVRARNLGCVFPATFTGVRTVKFFYIIHCFWQGNTLGFRQKHHKTTADGRQDTSYFTGEIEAASQGSLGVLAPMLERHCTPALPFLLLPRDTAGLVPTSARGHPWESFGLLAPLIHPLSPAPFAHGWKP